ncbi:MAG: PIN domain-containing protein [Halobacterium sp.]
MTLYDSSVLIDYLDGRERTVEYIRSNYDERAVAPPLVLFELYQGEVFKSGPTDLDAVDAALEWLVVVDETREFARAAAELQDATVADGTPLAARDAFVAGAASALDERLAVADDDFDADAVSELVDVEFV